MVYVPDIVRYDLPLQTQTGEQVPAGYQFIAVLTHVVNGRTITRRTPLARRGQILRLEREAVGEDLIRIESRRPPASSRLPPVLLRAPVLELPESGRLVPQGKTKPTARRLPVSIPRVPDLAPLSPPLPLKGPGLLQSNDNTTVRASYLGIGALYQIGRGGGRGTQSAPPSPAVAAPGAPLSRTLPFAIAITPAQRLIQIGNVGQAQEIVELQGSKPDRPVTPTEGHTYPVPGGFFTEGEYAFRIKDHLAGLTREGFVRVNVETVPLWSPAVAVFEDFEVTAVSPRALPAGVLPNSPQPSADAPFQTSDFTAAEQLMEIGIGNSPPMPGTETGWKPTRTSGVEAFLRTLYKEDDPVARIAERIRIRNQAAGAVGGIRVGDSADQLRRTWGPSSNGEYFDGAVRFVMDPDQRVSEIEITRPFRILRDGLVTAPTAKPQVFYASLAPPADAPGVPLNVLSGLPGYLRMDAIASGMASDRAKATRLLEWRIVKAEYQAATKEAAGFARIDMEVSVRTADGPSVPTYLPIKRQEIRIRRGTSVPVDDAMRRVARLWGSRVNEFLRDTVDYSIRVRTVERFNSATKETGAGWEIGVDARQKSEDSPGAEGLVPGEQFILMNAELPALPQVYGPDRLPIVAEVVDDGTGKPLRNRFGLVVARLKFLTLHPESGELPNDLTSEELDALTPRLLHPGTGYLFATFRPSYRRFRTGP